MRLINVFGLVHDPMVLEVKEFGEHNTPKYAILSHRWGAQEVTYKELTDAETFQRNDTLSKSGYKKILRAASVAADYRYQWLWCDTGCIDKTSSAELTEAINSMYRWYQESDLCLAYLEDYPSPTVTTFTQSEWFKRAWTLQELIAPTKVVFFDRFWNSNFENYTTGSKLELAEAIARRTNIDRTALLDGRQLERYSVAQRMSWAAGRQATRTEDIAYSLLGIFDVNMPMLYGEGKKAFARLQEEIMERNADQSIFVWTSLPGKTLFAESPDNFAHCAKFQMDYEARKPFTLNNLGLSIELELRMVGLNTYMAPLGVEGSEGPGSFAHLLLEIDGSTCQLCRVGSLSMSRRHNDFGSLTQRTRQVTILRRPARRQTPSLNALYGFRLGSDCLPLTVVNRWDPSHSLDNGFWGRWDFSGRPQAPSANTRSYRQRGGKRPSWDGQDLSMTLYPMDDRCKPVFMLPEKTSTSIAMLLLDLNGTDKFLIQLAFDFEFNPCCYVSRHTLDFAERFRERRGTLPEEDKRFTWPFDEFSWKDNLRSKEASLTDPATARTSWLIKSKERQEFDATIPAKVTHPHSGIEMSFSYHDPATREWKFCVRSSSEDLNQMLRRVGDQFAVLDANTGYRDRSSIIASP